MSGNGTSKPSAQPSAVLAVDVGSTSARAGVFDLQGRMLGSASMGFAVSRPEPEHAEHSSDEIWRAVGLAAKGAVAESGLPAEAIGGIAFDATCSLVLLGADGRPVTASTTGDDRWNVLMWADHRAVAEASEMTATGHHVLDYVGGTMSPEMELPKLLWLKRHLPAAWARFGRAMDLADFLTWRATGEAAISACTVTCKWTFLNHADGWQDDFLEQVGLDGLRAQMQLPAQALAVGGRVGGLCAEVAAEWGLNAGIAVGVGLIDAHAGALGVLGATPTADLNHQLALIAGTSNCHMAVSTGPREVRGVWGPYFGALMPSLWLNEGGQSATGALLDHLLDWHAEGRGLGPDRHRLVGDYLLARRAESGPESGPAFARDLLVLPDFHGNRSPLADPAATGLVCGLSMDSSFDSLCRLYHATAVGIAYGTRHIIDTLNARGYAIDQLHLTGGHAKSPLLVQLYADATGCDVFLPREADGVLLGTALAAATAAGLFEDLQAAGQAMVFTRERVAPSTGAEAVHDAGYKAFRLLLQTRQQVQAMLRGLT